MASGGHHQIENVTRNSYRWLIIAGTAGLLLSYSLFQADNFLTNSDKEQRLGETLRELRTSQTVLASGNEDPRQSAISSTLAVTKVIESKVAETVDGAK